MENEERREEMNEVKNEVKNEDIKVVEGTIVGGNENPTQNSQNVKKDEVVNNKKGLCIASLVLGIISIVFCCIYVISIPCAILALIFGIIGVKSTTKGMAIAGIITSAISLIVLVFMFIFFFFIGVTIGLTEGLSEEFENYNSSYNDTSYERFNDWHDYDYDL